MAYLTSQARPGEAKHLPLLLPSLPLPPVRESLGQEVGGLLVALVHTDEEGEGLGQEAVNFRNFSPDPVSQVFVPLFFHVI